MGDGYIELPDWLSPTAAPPRVEERPAQPDAARNPPPAAIRLPDGRTISVAGPTLLGRDPQPRPGETATTLVSTGPDRSVSKTHALLEPADDGVRLTDRRSTNGTAVLAPDGNRRVIPAETPAGVRRGERIRLGEVVIDVM